MLLAFRTYSLRNFGHSPVREVSVLIFRRLLFVCAFAAACSPEKSVERSARTDDFGDTVRVGAVPQRIVSLNPTTTELLFALGAGDRLVGRTTWDLFPAEAKDVPDLGPGIRPNVEAILAAHPDLVILYGSNDNRAASRTLRAAGVNTLSLKIDSIVQFQRAVTLLGAVLGDSARAKTVSDSVTKSLDAVRRATASLPRPTVFWHIWDAPPITIGRGSYMNELTDIAGGRNVYADIAAPSPTVSIEDVVRRNPDFMLAGPNGSKTMLNDQRWRQVPAVSANRVLVLDTMVVGRPGVKLGEAAWAIAR
ncbi:MAG: ABC transporter substrate-binding protein, partial [Gemmatimonadaceae bacterium]|nr:ABC transporter substrate-binding protein [Gemmatimonadaceae bacterium]